MHHVLVKKHSRWKSSITFPLIALSPLTHTDPSPPPVPSDLQVSHMTIGSDRSVSVQVSWMPPADPDVPVNHYKLSWSLTHGEGGHTMPSSLKKRKTISGVIPTNISSILIFSSSPFSLFPKPGVNPPY